MPQFLVKRAFLLHSTVPAIEGQTVELADQEGRDLQARGLVSPVQSAPAKTVTKEQDAVTVKAGKAK